MANNVDEILVTQPELIAPPVAESEPIIEDTIAPDVEVELPVEQAVEKEPEAAHIEETDDYGTPVSKKTEKIYTESEVNQMIRDRLARGKQSQPEPLPQYQQPVQQPTQSEIEGDWEAQLESFVDQTITKREQKLNELRWQQQEQERQAQFEIKFNQGASKYNDFEQVVMGKPLTAQMVMATRGMDDPAAFIYAAAKTQANEIERISKVNDPYQQAIELGRLEERMRKIRNVSSTAPKPLQSVKGDVSEKPKATSIDDKLHQAEQLEKQRRRR